MQSVRNKKLLKLFYTSCKYSCTHFLFSLHKTIRRFQGLKKELYVCICVLLRMVLHTYRNARIENIEYDFVSCGWYIFLFCFYICFFFLFFCFTVDFVAILHGNSENVILFPFVNHFKLEKKNAQKQFDRVL